MENKKQNNLLFEEMFVGLEVKDENGIVGKIIEIKDKHTVYVKYENGWTGVHCTEDNCKEFEPLFACET